MRNGREDHRMAITAPLKSITKVYRGDIVTESRTYTYGQADDWESEMPTQGDLEDGFYFIGYQQSNQDPVYKLVTLIWSNEETWEVLFQPAEGDNVWYADGSTTEEPIETHPDFLMKWAYDLFQRERFGDAVPAWWDTATTKVNADGTQWLWSKDHPGNGWKKEKDRTKIGVEAYLKPQFIARSEIHHRVKATAEAALKTIGLIDTPAEDFGYTNGNFL